jgi:hypothetical protein
MVASGYTAPVNFLVSLPTATYKFVFWADFVAKGTTTDLTYTTNNSGGLQEIEWKAATYAISDNLRDAYYAVETIDLSSSVTRNVTLRRPFGKLRILDVNLQGAITTGAITQPTKAVLTYTHASPPQFRKGFNALTGLPNAATIDASGALECVPAVEASVTVGGNTYNNAYLLAFDYFLVPADLTAVSFNIELFAGATSLAPAKSVSNIPVGINKLTTVIGSFVMSVADLDVVIEDDFNGEAVAELTALDITPLQPGTVVVAGGNVAFTVTTHSAWVYSISGGSGWLTEGAKTESALTLAAAANSGITPRSATVTFSLVEYPSITQTVTISQAAEVIDPLDNLSTYIFWKNSNIILEVGSVTKFDNDNSRALRNTTSKGIFIYRYPNMKAVTVDMYYYSANAAVSRAGVQLWYSTSPYEPALTNGALSSLSAFTQSTIPEEAYSIERGMAENWKAVTITLDTLPVGVNYLAIVIDEAGAPVWTHEIGNVTITYE